LTASPTITETATPTLTATVKPTDTPTITPPAQSAIQPILYIFARVVERNALTSLNRTRYHSLRFA
jgi:hypothetical protein